MKRGIITNNGQGIHISDGEVWMTLWEIAELFNTTAGVIHAAIKRMLRVCILKECLNTELLYTVLTIKRLKWE